METAAAIAHSFVRRVPILVAALLACSGRGTDSVAPPGSPPAQIAISPSAPSLSLGAQLALQAEVHDTDGQLIPGATIFWSSADSGIVAVSSTGVVTGRSVGTTQVAASASGASAVVAVTVLPVAVASVAVAPATVSLPVGGSVVLQGLAYDANGNTLDGRDVVWASTVPHVATVDAAGNVTAVTAGKATVTGTIEGKTAAAVITVTVIPVSAVAVSPSSTTLDIGQSAALSAVTTDANGNTLSGRSVTWSSASKGIATVSSAGLVAAVGSGTTTVSATSEGKTGSAQIVVSGPAPVAVASVNVSPATLTLNNTHPKTLTATVLDANNHKLTGRKITWSSSDASVVSVTSTGANTASVTAVKHGLGVVTITAICEQATGTSTVSYFE